MIFILHCKSWCSGVRASVMKSQMKGHVVRASVKMPLRVIRSWHRKIPRHRLWQLRSGSHTISENMFSGPPELILLSVIKSILFPKHCGQAAFNLLENAQKMNWNVFLSFWTENVSEKENTYCFLNKFGPWIYYIFSSSELVQNNRYFGE